MIWAHLCDDEEGGKNRSALRNLDFLSSVWHTYKIDWRALAFIQQLVADPPSDKRHRGKERPLLCLERGIWEVAPHQLREVFMK